MCLSVVVASDGETRGDQPRTPEQQQHPLQSSGQALHPEDPGPTPTEVHQSEEQRRQRGNQAGSGEKSHL